MLSCYPGASPHGGEDIPRTRTGEGGAHHCTMRTAHLLPNTRVCMRFEVYVLSMVRWIIPVGAVHCRNGSGVLTAVPPSPPCAHCMRTSHLLSIALVECANLFPERILLILTRCVRLSSEKSACAKVRPVRPVRKCDQRGGAGEAQQQVRGCVELLFW